MTTPTKSNFDDLKKQREIALARGIGSGEWIKCAQTFMDAFPGIYETAKSMNESMAKMREELALAQVGEFAGQAGQGHLAALVEALTTERDSAIEAGHTAVEMCGKLLAERDALRADAERYRWLRDRSEDPDIFIGVDSPSYPNRWALIGDMADKAIDAARAAS